MSQGGNGWPASLRLERLSIRKATSHSFGPRVSCGTRVESGAEPCYLTTESDHTQSFQCAETDRVRHDMIRWHLLGVVEEGLRGVVDQGLE
jgi:hypothetical protein